MGVGRSHAATEVGLWAMPSRACPDNVPVYRLVVEVRPDGMLDGAVVVVLGGDRQHRHHQNQSSCRNHCKDPSWPFRQWGWCSLHEGTAPGWVLSVALVGYAWTLGGGAAPPNVVNPVVRNATS